MCTTKKQLRGFVYLSAPDGNRVRNFPWPYPDIIDPIVFIKCSSHIVEK